MASGLSRDGFRALRRHRPRRRRGRQQLDRRTRSWWSASSRARVVVCENRGFGHANNRAFETTSAPYVLFLNPDTEILKGTFGDLVSQVAARPSLGVVGVRQVTPDGELFPTIRRFPSIPRMLFEAVTTEGGSYPVRRAPRARAGYHGLRPRDALRLGVGLVHARVQGGADRRRVVRREVLPLRRGGRSLPADQAGRLGRRPPPGHDDPPSRRQSSALSADLVTGRVLRRSNTCGRTSARWAPDRPWRSRRSVRDQSSDARARRGHGPSEAGRRPCGVRNSHRPPGVAPSDSLRPRRSIRVPDRWAPRFRRATRSTGDRWIEGLSADAGRRTVLGRAPFPLGRGVGPCRRGASPCDGANVLSLDQDPRTGHGGDNSPEGE